jgi:hypothetical protein
MFTIGAQNHLHGMAENLTRRDILDKTDGSLALSPAVSLANLISYRLGWTVATDLGGRQTGPRNRKLRTKR